MSHTNAIAALSSLRSAFNVFILSGGLQLDPTHEVGSLYLRLLSLEEDLAGKNDAGTNAPPVPGYRFPMPPKARHGDIKSPDVR